MARKAQAKKTTRTARKPPKAEKDEALNAALDAMMALAADLGWRDLTLADIAGEARLSLAGLRGLAASKPALLGKFVRRIDQQILEGTDVGDDADPVKDRLFDVAMRRFDALQPWRGAIKAIARDISCDPVAALCLGCRRHQSMAWMLEKAGVSSAGLKGRVRAAGLDMIMLSTMRVWLKDESGDMSATMAHLDRQLSRADRIVQSLQGRRPFQEEDATVDAG